MESIRLPGKPLLKIGEKTMIQRVYESAKKCKELDELFVATPNKKIYDHVNQFGNVVMTSKKPLNGTERVYEAYSAIGVKYDYIINIQGDEPFIKVEQIQDLIKIFKKSNGICTLVFEENYSKRLEINSVIKVVKTHNNEALYFSRSLIPFGDNKVYLRHICIYGYKTSILKKIVDLQPSALEKSESLEQLRWLENGFKIKLNKTKFDSFSVDTKEDLTLANRLINK